MKRTFSEFLDKKQRDSLKQLGLIKLMLELKHFNTESFLENSDDDDPYIYCPNPAKNTSFGGIRIYKVGDNFAYRVQKEAKTHPYGKAYPLNIEKMFQDLIGDEGINEEVAGGAVIEFLAKEIGSFFIKSKEAEQHARGDEAGAVVIKSTGTDYSSFVLGKN